MKKILFLVSCSIVAFNFNYTFASQNNEEEDFQTALKLSMEEYDRENAELIVALAESDALTKNRPTALLHINKKAEEETNEKPDDFYFYKASSIIKDLLTTYETNLKHATRQEKSQYYPPDDVRFIPDIIRDIEHDGENNFETRELLGYVRKEMEERGERYQLFKPKTNDYIREIAQQLNISSEKATRVYKMITLE
ncbi:MAG: hypothetical protein IBJ00_05700 [Alphaproteobacteria bacterium]|nr:hypothetical protein [Alphaproteobacteria bacterium]